MNYPTSLTKSHTLQENTFFIIWNLLKPVFASKIVNCGRFQVLTAALLSIKCYGIWCCVTGQVLLDLSKAPDCLTLKTKAPPSFEMSRSTRPITQQCHIPEELNVLLEFWGCSLFACNAAYLVDSTIDLGELDPPIFMEEEQQGSRFL